MDGITSPSVSAIPSLKAIHTAQIRHDVVEPMAHIAEEFGNIPMAMIALFVTPEADFTKVMAAAALHFEGVRVVGCTTAGEIGSEGYTEGEIVAIGFSASSFVVDTILIEDLASIDADGLIRQAIRVRRDLMSLRPEWENEFAFLTVDGLSIREDELVAVLARGLGPVPLFGGSAGDGRRFRETFVSVDGRTLRNAAVLSFVRTNCPLKVFTHDHLRPTKTRMVVTGAEPARRIVHTINAEPAAREYARLLGKDPEQLSAFTFAAHPVVVRFGGTHHVRAIQRVLDNGDLVFFSAIDEGLVLTLAEPQDIVAHLAQELEAIAAEKTPEMILACDCILRRVEAQQAQKTRGISDLLSRHRVRGFSTYGEQLNGLHVNHTMTGVAIYPPEA